MPVVPAETGFMSNAVESRLLRSDRYQGSIARGLAAAALRFVKQ